MTHAIPAHEVFVHPFVRPDHWEIADLWTASWTGMPDMRPHDRHDWLFSHIEALHEAGARTLCALNRRTGGIAGFATLDPEKGKLLRIVVANTARGSGVASALLDQCKRLSPGGLELMLEADNARAVRFFEREGFSASAGVPVEVQSAAPTRVTLRWRTQ